MHVGGAQAHTLVLRGEGDLRYLAPRRVERVFHERRLAHVRGAQPRVPEVVLQRAQQRPQLHHALRRLHRSGSGGGRIDRENPNIQDYFLGLDKRKL